MKGLGNVGFALLVVLFATSVKAQVRSKWRTIFTRDARQLLLIFTFVATMQTRTVSQTQPCILQIVEITHADGSDFDKWQCELHDLDALSSGRRIVDVQGLEESDLANVRSGDSTMYAEGATISNGILWVPSGQGKKFSRTTRKGPAEIQGLEDMEQAVEDLGQLRRGLSTAVVEQRSVLVVRVDASDRRLSNSTSAIVRSVFGTAGVNSLKERYETCSYGEVNIVPATGEDVSNGVITVTVGVNAANADNSVVRDAALTILSGKFGDLATRFDHVVLCIPPGTRSNGDSWIGYGRSCESV